MNSFLNVGDGAPQEISEGEHAHDPADAAQNVVCQKSLVAHLADSRHRWSEGPNNGDETRQNDGLAAVLLVKMLGSKQMVFPEEKGIFFLKYFWT